MYLNTVYSLSFSVNSSMKKTIQSVYKPEMESDLKMYKLNKIQGQITLDLGADVLKRKKCCQKRETRYNTSPLHCTAHLIG